MNDARMTIRLPRASLVFAHEYAEQTGTTVTDLVIRYFERIKASFATSPVPKSVRKVAGIVPQSIDAREDYRKHLVERYS